MLGDPELLDLFCARDLLAQDESAVYHFRVPLRPTGYALNDSSQGCEAIQGPVALPWPGSWDILRA